MNLSKYIHAGKRKSANNEFGIKKCEMCGKLQPHSMPVKGKMRNRVCRPCYRGIKADLDKMKRSGQEAPRFREYAEAKIIAEKLMRY